MELNDREQEIVDLLLKENALLKVDVISKKLFISEQTVRRRLKSLAEKGVVIRTHGGASLNYTNLKNQSIPLYLRMSKMSDAKSVIAYKASKYVKSGDLIFLDGSTTCFHMIPSLSHIPNITICTNSLKTALTLAEMKIKTILFGGEVNNNLLSNGYETIDQIKKYKADVLFFSCDALSSDGILTDDSRESNAIRLALMNNASKKILLVDYSKFNSTYHNVLCSLTDVDIAITNGTIDEKLKSLPKEGWDAK